MIYYGNRNYGCRFKEVLFHNTRTAIIENEKISVTILVDRGTDIISFNYKPQDTEFIWLDPVGLNILDKMNYTQWDKDYWKDNYYGGWFECFPNVGPSGRYMNSYFNENAEIKYLPFDMSVEKDTAEEVVLKFFAKCTKTPFVIEKYIKIKSNEPTLFIKEKITNLADKKCGFLWGHHPNAGGRFIDDDTIIDMPDCTLYTMDEDENKSEVFNWPYTYSEGKCIDLRKIMSGGENKTSALFYLNNIKEGWGAFRNPKKKLGFGFSWDIDMFKSGILWIKYDKSEVHCDYDGRRLITIFPKTADVNGLEEASKNGLLSYLGPHESKETWINATVFNGEKEVKTIDRNAKVFFK